MIEKEYKYMRKNLDNKWGLLELQDKILEIMSFIDELCKKNNIDYCLMGGSALGARRHGGFIPWDDDLDIFMFPEDYKKFRSLFGAKKYYTKYHLQEWGEIDGMVTMSKVRADGTTYIEQSIKDWDIHHGIYVDILILNKCPSFFLSRFNQFFWSKYILMKGLAEKKYKTNNPFIKVALFVMRLFPEYHLVKYGYKQIYKYNKLKNYKYYSYFFGRAVYKKAIYKREWFDEKQYVPFESIALKVPKELDDFLSTRFGNFMEYPSYSTIKSMQHAEIWDTKKDFREFRKGFCYTFEDERRLMG